MRGIHFEKFIPKGNNKGPFERLFNLFKELLVHTSGDVGEALDWMNEIDREHKLTTDSYGMGDFIEDLKKRGYLNEEGSENYTLSSKMEQSIRQTALNEIFGKIRKSGPGDHSSSFSGKGDEIQPEVRHYQFGDGLDKIALTESLLNAQIRNGTVMIGCCHADDLLG